MRRSDKQRLADAFHITAGLEELHLAPELDIAPGSLQPVVTADPHGERRIQLMRWGFKLPDRLLFNARSEAIATSAFWKDSFLERRCIVPADAIFEWQRAPDSKRKLKYEITLPGHEPFGMAAVWKPWKNPKTSQWEPSFAILTGEPNDVLEPIHTRMTTFLDPRDYAEYLDPAPRPPTHLLRILPAEYTHATRLDQSGITQPNLFDTP